MTSLGPINFIFCWFSQSLLCCWEKWNVGTGLHFYQSAQNGRDSFASRPKVGDPRVFFFSLAIFSSSLPMKSPSFLTSFHSLLRKHERRFKANSSIEIHTMFSRRRFSIFVARLILILTKIISTLWMKQTLYVSYWAKFHLFDPLLRHLLCFGDKHSPLVIQLLIKLMESQK